MLLSIGHQEVYFIESVKMFQHLFRNRSGPSFLVLINTSGRHPITIRLGRIAQTYSIPILTNSPYTSNEAVDLADVSFRFFTDQRENLGAQKKQPPRP